MDLNLKGRTALITGGSKGIGFGVARWLANEGVNIRLIARTEADLVEAAAKLEASTKLDVKTFAIDVADPAARKRAVDACGDIDILVNSAGGIPGGNLKDVDEEKWRKAWDGKVYGHINMCREVFYRMKARKKGVIINIVGIGGERLDDLYIAGATGNAALIAFSKALGSTSIDDGVRVLAVSPGPVATERLEFLGRKRAQDRLGDPERWREFHKNMPLGRAATVDECAAMVVFLCSDLCSYISGTNVSIDGGLTHRGALP
jgi:hypothetical protein